MSVLVATFLAVRFLGCQNAKRFRKRSIFERQGGRMFFFFGGSAWRVFFLAWKKKDDVDPLMKQVFEVLRDLLWVFFSHVYAVEGEKESDERVAEDV